MPKSRNSAKMKNAYRNMIIEYYIKKGESPNKILSILKSKKLGLRKKDFYAKVRIKNNVVKRFDTYKYTPKKYRKNKKIFVTNYLISPKEMKINYMYRISLAINDVPVHKKYVSFLLQAFSLDKKLLENKTEELKKLLVKMTNSYLGYNYNALAEWSGFHYYIAYESPTEIILNTSVLNTWLFIVERTGVNMYEKSGVL